MLDNDYITDDERRHLVSSLHRLLVWVGEPLPDDIDIGGKTIDIRDAVWQCIHKKELTEKEKSNLRDIGILLERKEKDSEDMLQTANLTHEEADKLHHEIMSIIRAVEDIKECEMGKVNLKDDGEDIRQRIDDAKRWMSFLKTIEKK